SLYGRDRQSAYRHNTTQPRAANWKLDFCTGGAALEVPPGERKHLRARRYCPSRRDRSGRASPGAVGGSGVALGARRCAPPPALSAFERSRTSYSISNPVTHQFQHHVRRSHSEQTHASTARVAVDELADQDSSQRVGEPRDEAIPPLLQGLRAFARQSVDPSASQSSYQRVSKPVHEGSKVALSLPGCATLRRLLTSDGVAAL
ncbi:Protein of unknown function, partial [Gryllus bimaculatus]